MTARSSIERLAGEAPVPHVNSWPARKPPSLAYAAACRALEIEAARTARAVIKARARIYALEPRQLDAIAEGLFACSPRDLVTALKQISVVVTMRRRWVGFGGEIQAINLKGSMLYARYARAKANQIARGAT